MNHSSLDRVRYELEAIYKGMSLRAEATSRCKRRKVGAVVLELTAGNIFSPLAFGVSNNIIEYIQCNNEATICGCMHAEAYLIIQLMQRFGYSTLPGNLLLMLTISPCPNCANLIVAFNKIYGVIYGKIYDSPGGNTGLKIIEGCMPTITIQDLREDSKKSAEFFSHYGIS